MDDTNKMLRTADIARRLSVSIRTVQRWIERGVIPAVRLEEGGMWLVAEDDFEKALQRNSLAPREKEE